MHDKYYYEKAQMAFIDTDPRINLAYGVAGLSIAIDSLSAIKYGKVPVSYTHLDVYKRQVTDIKFFLFRLTKLYA